MKSKNGFTLIELLTVIAILAIILLIASPIILGVLNDARKNVFINQIRLYVKGLKTQVELYAMGDNYSNLSDLNGNKIPLIILDDSSIEINATDINHIMDLEKLSGGKIKITNESGKVNYYVYGLYDETYSTKCEYIEINSLRTSDIELAGKNACSNTAGTNNTNDTELTGGDLTKVFTDGEVVYFNPITGRTCNDYVVENSLSNYNGTAERKTNDSQNGCLKWYAYADASGNSKVNLLLDHNSTALIPYLAYSTSDNSNFTMNDLYLQIMNDTSTWVGVPFINETIDEYDYTNMRARPISMDEINNIVLKNISNFTFSKNMPSNSYPPFTVFPVSVTGKWKWLIDNLYDVSSITNNYNDDIGTANNDNNTYTAIYYTNGSSNYNSNVYGYWTSTVDRTNNGGQVWKVTSYSKTIDKISVNSYQEGFRPVISVPKITLTGGTSKTYPENNESISTSSGTYDLYENGTIVYFNPTTGKKCDSDTVKPRGTYALSGCLTWYAFNDNASSSSVNLLLSNNINGYSVWTSDLSNPRTPKEVITDLNDLTKYWVGVPKLTGSVNGINYSGMRARLISATEIAQITGNTTFDVTTAVSSNNYWFEDNMHYSNTSRYYMQPGSAKYKWLFNNTSSCQTYGCDNNEYYDLYQASGYWTSDALPDSTNSAWLVWNEGTIYDRYVANAYAGGIRPVITISKSKLK